MIHRWQLEPSEDDSHHSPIPRPHPPTDLLDFPLSPGRRAYIEAFAGPDVVHPRLRLSVLLQLLRRGQYGQWSMARPAGRAVAAAGTDGGRLGYRTVEFDATFTSRRARRRVCRASPVLALGLKIGWAERIAMTLLKPWELMRDGGRKWCFWLGQDRAGHRKRHE